MQGYVPARDGAFAESGKCFGELEDWLVSEEAAGLQHADLEEQLDVRGRELLRRLFQDRLGGWGAAEGGGHDVGGGGGGGRAPGRPNVHPADAALNLPEEKHSHGLRRLTAVEAARGSMEDAQAAVTRAT